MINLALTPAKLVVTSFVMVGMIVTGFLFLDGRYLSAEDAKQKFVTLESKLDLVYVQQLKQEARTIVRDAKREERELTNHEYDRIDDIADTLRKFGSKLFLEVPARVSDSN